MSSYRFSSEASDQGSTPDADPIYEDYTTTSGYTTTINSHDPLYSSPYETSISSSSGFIQQPEAFVHADQNVEVNTSGLNAWTHSYDVMAAAQVSLSLTISS